MKIISKTTSIDTTLKIALKSREIFKWSIHQQRKQGICHNMFVKLVYRNWLRFVQVSERHPWRSVKTKETKCMDMEWYDLQCLQLHWIHLLSQTSTNHIGVGLKSYLIQAFTIKPKTSKSVASIRTQWNMELFKIQPLRHMSLKGLLCQPRPLNGSTATCLIRAKPVSICKKVE